MKFTSKFLMILTIASLLVLTSCSKEGDIGPMGPRGEQGLQGIEGKQGPAGQNGESQETTGSEESQAGGTVEGEQGDSGPEGEQGQQGDSGPKGEQGEQGATGEQGAEGVQGQDGEDGQDGQDGEDGEDGNANVIDSGWLPAEFNSGRMRVVNPALTTDVVNNSVIMVFGVWSDGEEYIFQFPHQVGDEKFSFYLINDGPGAPFAINFLAQAPDESPLDEVFRCDAVKYFILPSNTLTGKSSFDNIKKMSYQDVVNHFGLEY